MSCIFTGIVVGAICFLLGYLIGLIIRELPTNFDIKAENE